MAHQQPPHTGAPLHAPGHETRDVTFAPIVWAAAGMLVVLLLVFVLVRWTYDAYLTRLATQSPPANPLAASYARQLAPEPRLQTKPVQDLAALHAAEDAVLTSYGWVDRRAGIVHIPIARAMQLLAERGLPATAETDQRR